jgi:C-terminal processing protease CtpA/Prc
MSKTLDDSTMARWRLARRLTLGGIVVAGSLATALAVTHRLSDAPCRHFHSQAQTEVDNYYTYSGIGVEMARDGEDFVIRRVFPGSPADGRLFPGAKLIAVDGVEPAHMNQWSNQIRGEAGTEVQLTVEYPCAGVETLVLQREVIRLRY